MKRLLVLFVILAGALWAQPQQQVGIWPDCVQFYHFTAAAQVTPNYDNRQLGCTDWTVTYTASGFGALTLIAQSANDAAGAPGAWGNYAGAVVSGVNPNIAITYATTVMSGYQSWMRMRLNAVVGAGNVWGVIYGWKTRPIAATLVGGTVQGMAAEGAAVVGNPVLEAGWDGVHVVTPIFCPSSAVITLAGAGTTQLVALSGVTRIRICHVSLALDAAVNVHFIQGTGAACAGATADVTGDYKGVLSMALGFPQNPLTLVAGNALCVTIGAANAGGVVQYAQY